MNKKRLIIGGILVFVLLFAGLVASRVQQKKAREEALKHQVPPPTAVAVAQPHKGRLLDILKLPGNVVAMQEVQLVPKVSGRLTALYIKEGSPVYRGQTLGEIEHTELDAQLLQAKASAQAAKANLNQMVNGPLQTQIAQARASVRQLQASLGQLQASRAQSERDLLRQQNLASEGVITAQQLEMSKTQLQSSQQQILAMEQQIVGARANLQQLLDGTRPEQIEAARAQYNQALATIQLYQAQLQNYRLVSPLTGVVTQQNLDPGSFVGPPNAVLSLAENSRPEIELFLPERELERIQLGQRVQVRSSGLGQRVLVAQITAIAPVVNPQTRLVKLTAQLDRGSAVRSGMLLDCEIVLAEKTQALTVPPEALIRENNKTWVYTVNLGKDAKTKNQTGTVQAKTVLTGLRTPEAVEIRQGLSPLDQVIVKGTSFVRPGDKVQIQPAVKEVAPHGS